MKNIKTYFGEDINPYLDTIANWRIEAFKEFPYLYSGELTYETKYLDEYIKNPMSILSIAKENNDIIALSTGLPLNSNSQIVLPLKQELQKKHYPIDRFYYYGEFIVASMYRNKGLAKQLCMTQDSLIKNLGFNVVCILTVEREENHLLKPYSYFNTDLVWLSCGFTKSNFTIEFEWPTIQYQNKTKNQKNLLRLWMKEIL